MISTAAVFSGGPEVISWPIDWLSRQILWHSLLSIVKYLKSGHEDSPSRLFPIRYSQTIWPFDANCSEYLKLLLYKPKIIVSKYVLYQNHQRYGTIIPVYFTVVY
jgi:hypothetical protein